MKSLQTFQKFDFRITWKLLHIGYHGSTEFGNELLAVEVIEHAISEMMKNSDDPDIIALACENESNTEKVKSTLVRLCDKERTEYEVELKKWRVAYVAQEMGELKEDYVSGLIELINAWAKFGFPDDSPLVLQGRYNNITPKEYYTRENYEYLYRKHEEWIENEIGFIRHHSEYA